MGYIGIQVDEYMNIYIYMNMIEYEYVYMNRFYDIDVMYIIHDDSYIHIILYSHIYIYIYDLGIGLNTAQNITSD